MTPTNDPIAALAAEPAPLDRLREGLIAAGETDGLIDAVYTRVATPIGELFLAAGPHGVLRLGFEGETDTLDHLISDVGPRVFHVLSPERGAPGMRGVLAQATAELGEYFAGSRREFTVPIDLRLPGFRGEVVRTLPSVPYGARVSYKELAASMGNPGAVRAVGTACASNPIPIFIPCHRVVRSDGTWGNYRGGRAAKSWLLELELCA